MNTITTVLRKFALHFPFPATHLNLILATLFLLGVISCKSMSNGDCIDTSKISDGPCTFEYAPVCGCDNKTYSNACAAERAGVTTWTKGECAEAKEE